MTKNNVKKESSKKKVFESKVCEINIDAEFYRMVSGGLYPDPIKAIVREYGTNAVDSHVQANNPDPFEVHVPSLEEPYFTVRDFGVGLTQEEVSSVWGAYFKSTKRGDDTQVGFFGLGSKAAISIYSTFTVTSYRDGKLIRCVVQLDEAGVPSILVETSPQNTSEPTGVKVHIPVSKKDINIFQKKIKEVYQYFSLQPKLVGDAAFDLEPIRYDTCIELPSGISVRTHQNFLKESGCIVFGGIPYGLPQDKLHYWQNFDLHVPIGMFQPTPNREEIQWSSKAIEQLDAIYGQLKSYLEQRFKALLARQDLSPAERFKELQFLLLFDFSLLHNVSHGKRLDERVRDEASRLLNSVKLNSSNKSISVSSSNVLTLNVSSFGNGDLQKNVSANSGPGQWISVSDYVIKPVKKTSWYVFPFKPIVVIDVDVRCWRSAFIKWRSSYSSSPFNHYLVYDASSQALIDVMKNFDVTIPVMKLSEMAGVDPMKPEGKKVSSPKRVVNKKVGCFSIKDQGGQLSSSSFYSCPDISKAEYFLVINDRRVVEAGLSKYQRVNHFDLMSYFKEILSFIGIKDLSRVVAIRNDRVSLHPNLKSFNTMILERVDREVVCDIYAVNAIYQYVRSLSYTRSSDYFCLSKFLDYIRELHYLKPDIISRTNNPLVQHLHKIDGCIPDYYASFYMVSVIRDIYKPADKDVYRRVSRILSKWMQLVHVCPCFKYEFAQLVKDSVFNVSFLTTKLNNEYISSKE